MDYIWEGALPTGFQLSQISPATRDQLAPLSVCNNLFATLSFVTTHQSLLQTVGAISTLSDAVAVASVAAALLQNSNANWDHARILKILASALVYDHRQRASTVALPFKQWVQTNEGRTLYAIPKDTPINKATLGIVNKEHRAALLFSRLLTSKIQQDLLPHSSETLLLLAGLRGVRTSNVVSIWKRIISGWELVSEVDGKNNTDAAPSEDDPLSYNQFEDHCKKQLGRFRSSRRRKQKGQKRNPGKRRDRTVKEGEISRAISMQRSRK